MLWLRKPTVEMAIPHAMIFAPRAPKAWRITSEAGVVVFARPAIASKPAAEDEQGDPERVRLTLAAAPRPVRVRAADGAEHAHVRIDHVSFSYPGASRPVLRDVQQAFYGLCVNAGRQVLAAMMEADRVAVCGARNVPDPGRTAVRGGTTRSSVMLGGQRIAVTKPQARSLQHGDPELPT